MILGLQGKVVLVTGASGGIGSAIAAAFTAEGATVVTHGFLREADQTGTSGIRRRSTGSSTR